MMKNLRKSLNGHKDHSSQISTPLPSLSKPPSAILPPSKVIKALQTYKSNAPQELSFEKGDFFHVLNDVNGQGTWYEAHNPATGARGLVPCHMFEEFQKGTAKPRSPTTNGAPTGSAATDRPLSAASAKHQAFYAVVLHDFSAERADELDAKAGDSITIVAQSNREWFVAKPIGRLGRPGLIPVAFVEVRDPATGRPVQDIMALIDGGALPRVEEWKRAMLNYKANSISLGVLDESSVANVFRSPSTKQASPATVAVPPPTQQQPKPKPPSPGLSRPTSPKLLPEGILLSADVKSFHYEMEEYWFRIHAVFQPYNPSGSNSLPPAKQLVLFRSYNDFYDFQVDLLDAFPREAGRPDVNTRILPYMPGPADHVDNAITNTRRSELDEYLHKLCELQQYARYILEHRLIRVFLALKPGDAEVEVEPRTKEIAALDQTSYATGEVYEEELYDPDYGAERMSQLHISAGANGHTSDGSDYGDADDIGASYGRDQDDYHYTERRPSQLSLDPNFNTTQPLRPRSRTTAGHERADNPMSMYGRSSKGSVTALQLDSYHADSQSRSSVSSYEPSPVSTRASQAGSTATSRTSTSGRSRSQSNATYNPPISVSNPQIAFMKIKIFDKTAEDIVALRVHPRVTYTQLLEKASSRLNCQVQKLRFLDGETKAFVDLETDEDLRGWLAETEKHLLYAV